MEKGKSGVKQEGVPDQGDESGSVVVKTVIKEKECQKKKN